MYQPAAKVSRDPDAGGEILAPRAGLVNWLRCAEGRFPIAGAGPRTSRGGCGGQSGSEWMVDKPPLGPALSIPAVTGSTGSGTGSWRQ